MEYINYVLDSLKNSETRAILGFIGTFVAILIAAIWQVFKHFSDRSKKLKESKEIEISNGKIINVGSNIVNIVNINLHKTEVKNLNNVAGVLEGLISDFSHSKINFADNFDGIINLLGDIAFHKGVVEESNGIYAEADRWFTQAIQFQPNNPHFLNSAGNIKRILGFYEEAEKLFKRAVEILGDYEY